MSGRDPSAPPRKVKSTSSRPRDWRTSQSTRRGCSSTAEGSRPMRTSRAQARERLERAITLFKDAGDTHSAARASIALADVDATDGRLDEAAARLEQALADSTRMSRTTPRSLVRSRNSAACTCWPGTRTPSVAPLERALQLAERLQLPDVFVNALTSKAIALSRWGRPAEAAMLLEAAIVRAHEEQLYAGAIPAQNNLAVSHQSADRYADAINVMERSIALCRRRGDRRFESNLRTGQIEILSMLGRWDEALAVTADEEPLAEPVDVRAVRAHDRSAGLQRARRRHSCTCPPRRERCGARQRPACGQHQLRVRRRESPARRGKDRRSAGSGRARGRSSLGAGRRRHQLQDGPWSRGSRRRCSSPTPRRRRSC